MRYLILLSLLSLPIECRKIRVKKHKKRTNIRLRRDWRVRSRRIATQNMPNEMLRPIRHQEANRCLVNAKEIITIVAALTALGITIATFIIAIA